MVAESDKDTLTLENVICHAGVIQTLALQSTWTMMSKTNGSTREQGTGVSIAARLPPTSLIIGSRNRPKMLLETVESVIRGDEVPAELIIIDQSDVPHPMLPTLKHDRACEIRYLWTHSVGVSRARNAGAAAARHDILVGIDDDMLVSSTWFGTLVRALVNAGPGAIVTGKVLPAEPEVPGGFVLATRSNEVPVVYQGRVAKDPLALNMAFYRSAFDDVGGFDERLGPGAPFVAAEDCDFGFRLLEAGYRIVYVPGAVLYHRAWRSEREYLRMRWNYGRGLGAFYAKHLTLRDPHMLKRIWAEISHCAYICPRRSWRHRRLAYGDVIHLSGVFSGALQWLATQRSN
jgi:GT2 family glycosyltransferase